MKFHIAGIPCTIQVDSISGEYIPAHIYADPNDCYPAEYPEVEFTVCDRKGYPAPWLAKKMSAAESMEIESLILEEYV
jgi:hypothetical protein